MAFERIQKILARAGVASRREAERMMLEGRVMVNGKVIDTLGFQVDPSKDSIKVDGKRISAFEPKVILLLNKPRGYLSTVRDPKGRPTVLDLIQSIKWRIYPVGRLDSDAEGLLLLTNDGDLAYHLSHPRFSIPKTYLVKVRGVLDEKGRMRLIKGIRLEDGEAKALSCRLIREKEKSCWVRIVVTEGRNRLVKRMFSSIGHPVLKLKRIEYGPIQLGNLPFGHFRYLTQGEVKKLKQICSENRVGNLELKSNGLKL